MKTVFWVVVLVAAVIASVCKAAQETPFFYITAPVAGTTYRAGQT